MPAFLNLRRLEGRIVALFLGLLVVVQLLSFGVIRAGITRNAEVSLDEELKTGDHLLGRLVDQQAVRLHDTADLVSKDYGFKQAVVDNNDVETIKSALQNHGDRIGASVAAYYDNRLKLVAATRADGAPFWAALNDLVRNHREATLLVANGHAYQVVVVEMRTPGPMGWVLMGFELDRAVLDDVKALSQLDAALVLREGDGGWSDLIHTLAATPDWGRAETPTLAELGGERVSTRYVELLGDGSQRLGVVLLRSLDAALAPYRMLQYVLLGLSVFGVLLFAVVSVLLARGISQPISALSAAARRLEAGDYATPVQAGSRLDEVSELSQALESMREGIQRRDALVVNLAYVDQLTGLPNRARFAEVLQELLISPGVFGAVLMLNLDRFKRVNDVLGREFGDLLLQSVARRLLDLCGPTRGVLARLTGDEFVILLAGVDARGASEAALAILKNFEQPMQIEDETIDLGAGIGIALFPEHGVDVNQLLERAELAMHAAKQRQCGSLVYHVQLDAGSQESLSLMSELRRAIEGRELRLFFQPKVDLQQRRIIGGEALVRWQHPQRGLVPPMQFIPFAEQTGFIRQLTAWVLAETAQFSRAAMDAGLSLRLSVNLSTRDLMDQDLPAKIESLLAPLEIPPSQLCLEITESAIMDDPERALATLEHLHAMGFKLSIDDFGTGYSSLAYLKRLPVDELKIDRSFVMAMERDLDDARIVRSTIELAHNLGLSVVAEGLENAKAWGLLAALGCDEGQGYFLAKPMPADQFIDWIQAWQSPELGDGGQTMLASLTS